jgi:hypothetical protein
MSENGIKKIEDLIDDNNRFLTYQMFLDKCNVNINAITYATRSQVDTKEMHRYM